MTTLIKIEEACEELNVSRQTLYNWNKKHLITFEKSPSGGLFIVVDNLYEKMKKFYGNYATKQRITSRQ